VPFQTNGRLKWRPLPSKQPAEACHIKRKRKTEGTVKKVKNKRSQHSPNPSPTRPASPAKTPTTYPPTTKQVKRAEQVMRGRRLAQNTMPRPAHLGDKIARHSCRDAFDLRSTMDGGWWGSEAKQACVARRHHLAFQPSTPRSGSLPWERLRSVPPTLPTDGS